MAVMVLFRDRFRLVAPSSGTKFAHALIKYRLSQMSLHRIHHPPQKAMHDPRKAPLSAKSPKPTRALWLVFQLFAQLACFPIASGWGILPVLRLFTQPTCFPLASGWGIFPISQLFPKHACTCQQILDTKYKKIVSYIVRLYTPYATLDIAPRNAGQIIPTV